MVEFVKNAMQALQMDVQQFITARARLESKVDAIK